MQDNKIGIQLGWSTTLFEAVGWLDIKNLWLGKAASPKYTKIVLGIRYGNESCEYDKAGCTNIRIIKKTKNPDN